MSLYTWTKSVAAGAYLVPFLLGALGLMGWTSPLWTVAAPVIGMIFLALTGVLLIWDLEHPERFYMIFTRPQWRSWLVRGGFFIGGYGAVLAGHFALGQAGAEEGLQLLAWAGVPLATMTSVYTAFLFAQAKARDLWQNPLLPPHLLVQALFAGSGVLMLIVAAFGIPVLPPLPWIFAASAAAHLFMVAGEYFTPPPTAHARLAHHEMTRGAFARYYWVGNGLVVVALLAPAVGAVGVVAGLLGLLAFEHAFVQGGQHAPLA